MILDTGTRAALAYIDAHPDVIFTQRDNAGRGYVCPCCGNGSHHSQSRGLVERTDSAGHRHYTCFSQGCFTNADILDVIGVIRNVSTFREKLEEAARLYGFTIGKDGITWGRGGEPVIFKPRVQAARSAKPEKPLADYAEFCRRAVRNIGCTDYLARRGISEAVQKRFGIGFVPDWRPPGLDRVPPSPRIIIPTGPNSYFARDIRADKTMPEPARRYTKQKVGPARMLNLEGALKSHKPVFIVEGEIDALSIVEAGHEAVALGSVSMARRFLEAAEKADPDIPFIIALDNDRPGQQAVAVLEAGLKTLQRPFLTENISLDCKDPNEALMTDRKLFQAVLDQAADKAKCIAVSRGCCAHSRGGSREIRTLSSHREDEERTKKEAEFPAGSWQSLLIAKAAEHCSWEGQPSPDDVQGMFLEQIARITNPGELQRFLKFRAVNPHCNIRNALALYAQDPDVYHCHTAEGWETRGYRVRKHARKLFLLPGAHISRTVPDNGLLTAYCREDVEPIPGRYLHDGSFTREELLRAACRDYAGEPSPSLALHLLYERICSALASKDDPKLSPSQQTFAAAVATFLVGEGNLLDMTRPEALFYKQQIFSAEAVSEQTYTADAWAEVLVAACRAADHETAMLRRSIDKMRMQSRQESMHAEKVVVKPAGRKDAAKAPGKTQAPCR